MTCCSVVVGSLFIDPSYQGSNLIGDTFFFATGNYSDHRLEWAIGLAKLGREKAQTTWQTEIFDGN
jgi:hypothetical protein